MTSLDLEKLDLEELFNGNKYPAMRIIYTGESTRSKVERSMLIFEKLTFSAEKYDIPIQIEVKKGESVIITIILSEIGKGILLGLGEDLYTYMKKKILEQTKKPFKSKIKVETNKAWKVIGLPPINSNEIHDKNDEENKDGRLHA